MSFLLSIMMPVIREMLFNLSLNFSSRGKIIGAPMKKTKANSKYLFPSDTYASNLF